jgi:general nucleoside transport system permease protein
MTTLDLAPTSSAEHKVVVNKSWRVPIILGVFALISILLFMVLGRDGTSTFTFTGDENGSIVLPELPLGTRATGIVVAILAVLLAIGSALFVRAGRKTPLWYIAIFTVVVIVGFLAWTTANHTLHVTGLLTGSLALSAPLIFGALGGLVSERVGVTNVAIEGQLLAGAFVAAVSATITHSIIVGIICAMLAGVLVSFVLGAFAVKYAVNQVIVGIVLNVLVLGLTTFFYQIVLVNNQLALNSPPQLKDIDIPLLSQIPVIGPLLFSQNLIVYLMYVAVVVVAIGLARTRWGLRLRAVGEHPQAADTVGINVSRTRFWNVALAGAIVGLGGAYFTIGNVGAFSQNITTGTGYIALAAVIFGGWNPVRATLAALLFGFASNLQSVLGILGSPVPNDFLLMLPYLVTIFAVAGLVGRSRGPAAAGRPYIKS